MKEWTVNIYKNQKKIIDMHFNETINIHKKLLSLHAILPQINPNQASWISREPEPNFAHLKMNLTYKQHDSGTNTYKYEHQTVLNFGTMFLRIPAAFPRSF